MTSTATIRSNNIKESKEKRNREKLLAGPGSEFSLVNPEDLELDYYDYNVTNAGAAPGSYLGMDPAYLVWIPPLDDGVELSESDGSETDIGEENEPYYEEILPSFPHIHPGSNTETPTEEAPDLPPLNGSTSGTKIYGKEEQNKNHHNLDLNKVLAATTFKEDSPQLNNRHRFTGTMKSASSNPNDSIPMQEFVSKKNIYQQRYVSSPVRTGVGQQHVYSDEKDNDNEKETDVIKSPIDNAGDYYELDDIQFVDDEDDEDDDDMTNSMAAEMNDFSDNRTKIILRQTEPRIHGRQVALSSFKP